MYNPLRLAYHPASQHHLWPLRLYLPFRLVAHPQGVQTRMLVGIHQGIKYSGLPFLSHKVPGRILVFRTQLRTGRDILGDEPSLLPSTCDFLLLSWSFIDSFFWIELHLSCIDLPICRHSSSGLTALRSTWTRLVNHRSSPDTETEASFGTPVLVCRFQNMSSATQANPSVHCITGFV